MTAKQLEQKVAELEKRVAELEAQAARKRKAEYARRVTGG